MDLKNNFAIHTLETPCRRLAVTCTGSVGRGWCGIPMGEDGSTNGSQTWVVVVVSVFSTALPLRGCRLHGLQDAPSFKMVAVPPVSRDSLRPIWPSFLKFPTRTKCEGNR